MLRTRGATNDPTWNNILIRFETRTWIKGNEIDWSWIKERRRKGSENEGGTGDQKNLPSSTGRTVCFKSDGALMYDRLLWFNLKLALILFEIPWFNLKPKHESNSITLNDVLNQRRKEESEKNKKHKNERITSKTCRLQPGGPCASSRTVRSHTRASDPPDHRVFRAEMYLMQYPGWPGQSQKLASRQPRPEAVPRRARIWGSYICSSLNSRLESQKNRRSNRGHQNFLRRANHQITFS